MKRSIRSVGVGVAVAAAALTVSVAQPSFGSPETADAEVSSSPVWPRLTQGASGHDVRTMKGLLKAAGYDVDPSNGGFGPKTARLVRNFKVDHGLDDNSVMGWRAWRAAVVRLTPPDGDGGAVRSPAVRAVKFQLVKHGYDVNPDRWLYSDRAASFVKDFKRSHGLRSDRVVGINAWKHLLGDSVSRELKVDYQAQQTGYFCGPAATRHALSARGISVSQRQMANELPTHTGGTDHISQVARVLNNHDAGDYTHVNTYGDPMSSTKKKAYWANVKRSIDDERAVVVNIVSMPSSKPSHYPNSTIYHYFTVTGYDAGKKTVTIVDSAFGKPKYSISFDQLARLTAGKGYAYHRG